MKKSKKMLKTFVSLLIMGMTIVPAFATNWVLIGDGHYIDTDSIVPASTYGSYTYSTEYLSRDGRPIEIINDKQIYTIKTDSYVDCRSNFAKTVAYYAYDKNRKQIYSSRNIGKQWYDINTPGSRAYESYRYVCTDQYLNARRGYSPLWWY